MAISILGSSTDSHGTGSSLTFSHTVTSGTDVLVVCAGGAGDPIGVSGVTFNGVALTKLDEGSRNQAGTTDPHASVWHLVNPTATTANVVVTPNDVTPGVISGGAINFDGVDTSTPFEDNNNNNGLSTAASVSLTVTSSGAWMVGSVASVASGTAMTPSDVEVFENVQATITRHAGGYDDAGTTGSRSISWTVGNDDWAIAGGVLKPASAVVTIIPNDAAIATSVDTTTITQDHVVVAQDSAIATSTDNDTITQDHVIATQDSTISTTTDNDTITQNHIVATQDSAIATSLDNATVYPDATAQDMAIGTSLDSTAITQNHIISVQDTTVSTTIDNTTTDNVHIIAANDITISSSTDNTTITQNHVVSPADVGLSTATDDDTINQNHVLSPADLSLSSQIDSILISQNHSVTGQDVSLSTLLDNTSLTQNHTVAINDLLLALTLDNDTITQAQTLLTADIALGLSMEESEVEDSPAIPYRLLPRTRIRRGSRQNNFRLTKRGPRQLRS
jgi:hypothetical protein